MNAKEILERVSKGELSAEQASNMLNPVTFKVSEKGAVSVYGLQRFPVTLYKNQWDILLGKSKEIAEFIHQNDRRLTNK